MFPKDRKQVKIKELLKDGSIIEIQDGNHGGIHPKSSDFVKFGIPFIMSNNIKDNVLDLEDCCFIAKEQADKLRIGFSKEGDVLLTHKGTVGSVCIVPTLKTGYIMLTPQVTYYRTNEQKLHNKYLKYFFLSSNFQSILKQFSAQATRPYIGITAQKELEIFLPPLPTQQRIASILSTYDDLIENNTRRIKILEEQAQLIYKKRFVKFKFPGWEKVKMKDSGTEFGEIPEGWEVKNLGDCVKVSRGQNITKDTVENGKIPVIAGGLMPSCYHSKSNTKGPVITISASGANAGYVNLHYQDVRASDSSYIDRSVTPFVYYYYLLFKDRQFEISGLQRGAAIPHVYAADLMGLLVIDVPDDIIQKFMKTINPIFEDMGNLQKQNKNLKETRDMLIPKLVSGEVEV